MNNEKQNPSKCSSKCGKCIRILIACIVAVVAFYLVENWRGNRAWNACRNELTAKGEQLDWLALVPKAVPDDQNMMIVPLVDACFNRQTKNTNLQFRFKQSSSLDGLARRLAEKYPKFQLVFIQPSVELQTTAKDVVLTSEQFAKTNVWQIFEGKTSAAAQGRRFQGPAGYDITANRPVTELHRVYVRSATTPSIQELEALKKRDLKEKQLRSFNIFPTAKPNEFTLLIPESPYSAEYPAADFLEWTDQFKPEFDAIREAARRPYSQIVGDYTDPWGVPVPNFVSVRTFCQTAAARALANLLLDRPDEAVKDLAMIKDADRVLEGGVTNLVNAMIRVAIMGLYVATVETGFTNGLWKEAHWNALQEQMRPMERLGDYVNAMRTGERAQILYMLEKYSRDKLAKIISDHGWSGEALYVRLAPGGWFKQNMVKIAYFAQESVEAVDLKQMRVFPEKSELVFKHLSEEFNRTTPYNVICSVATPNARKAMITTTKNQTQIYQAMVVCGLERYRKENGAYPENLASLLPKYLDKLPHDLISGLPLLYKRVGDAQFLLYSVGWDGKDDSGVPSPANKLEQGDWVWGMRPG